MNIEICEKIKQIDGKGEPFYASIPITFLNLRMNGKKIEYYLEKPFNSIFVLANSPDWKPLLDAFLNLKIDFKVNTDNIRVLLDKCNIEKGFRVLHLCNKTTVPLHLGSQMQQN